MSASPAAPILVVDDDADIREIMTVALESSGYPVISAADGIECLEMLRRRGRPRLILLDLMMPRMDGWAVCAALAADPQLAGVPVVVLTGNSRATPAGLCAAGFLRKPFDLPALLEVVRRYLPPS
jgi:two-component system response regulator CpxR